MGWYFRKSLSFGGLRLNFSKRGVGVSAGVRGLRFGISPGGKQYIHCGTGGIYYRKTFSSGGGRSRQPSSGQSHQPAGSVSSSAAQVIDSGDVNAMVDSSATELLAEIHAKHRLRRLHRWYLAAIIIAITAAIVIQEGHAFLPALIGLAAVGVPALWLLDRRRKLVERYYDVDPGYGRRYDELAKAFRHLMTSRRVWLIESTKRVHDRKYNAGADSAVTRTAIAPRFALPAYFRSNVTPPMLPAGRQQLYFLPDTILVFEDGRVGAVGYGQVQFDVGVTQFIESAAPPSDSTQVGQTWQYVNKSGGPDRRFATNRTLPIMRYGELRLWSQTGLNEAYQTSRVDAATYLAGAVQNLTAASRAPAVVPRAAPSRNSSGAREPWPEV